MLAIHKRLWMFFLIWSITIKPSPYHSVTRSLSSQELTHPCNSSLSLCLLKSLLLEETRSDQDYCSLINTINIMLSSCVSATNSSWAPQIFNMLPCPQTISGKKQPLPPRSNDFLLQCRGAWTDITASSVCNRLHFWSRVKGSCCAFCVQWPTVFMLITCLKARADTELWCLGSCWTTLNESIMSQARVEQPDSLSSQRYPCNVLKTIC